jgi:hypothetical protein
MTTIAMHSEYSSQDTIVIRRTVIKMPQCCKNIITSSLKYVLNVRVESFYQNNKEVFKSINDQITLHRYS